MSRSSVVNSFFFNDRFEIGCTYGEDGLRPLFFEYCYTLNNTWGNIFLYTLNIFIPYSSIGWLCSRGSFEFSGLGIYTGWLAGSFMHPLW